MQEKEKRKQELDKNLLKFDDFINDIKNDMEFGEAGGGDDHGIIKQIDMSEDLIMKLANNK